MILSHLIYKQILIGRASTGFGLIAISIHRFFRFYATLTTGFLMEQMGMEVYRTDVLLLISSPKYHFNHNGIWFSLIRHLTNVFKMNAWIPFYLLYVAYLCMYVQDFHITSTYCIVSLSSNSVANWNSLVFNTCFSCQFVFLTKNIHLFEYFLVLWNQFKSEPLND